MNERTDFKTQPKDFVDCWSDDERMNFLFSAFPPKQSDNPHHWDTKMNFWTNLIEEMAANIPHTFITWENLFSKLCRNGKQPLGLPLVLKTLLDGGELIPLTQYMQDVRSDETWVSWGVKWCVRKPVSWMADKVMSPIKTSPAHEVKKGKFVLKSALDKKCDKLLTSLHDFVSYNKCDYHFLNIVSYSKLCELAKDIACDQQSMDTILSTMCKNKVIEFLPPDNVLESEPLNDSPMGENYIKFVKKGEKKVAPFSDADFGIVRLCETRSRLQDLIHETYQEISKSTEKTKIHLQNQQRSMAKIALRKKKRLEASLDKKEKSLANVEELLERLHQCGTDKMVMETYKSAVAAYNNMSEGLDLKEVHKTMDEVNSILEVQSEASEALSSSVAASDADDMQELEDEFAALMNLAVENTENYPSTRTDAPDLNSDASLPEVPRHLPTGENQVHRRDESSGKQEALV